MTKVFRSPDAYRRCYLEYGTDIGDQSRFEVEVEIEVDLVVRPYIRVVRQFMTVLSPEERHSLVIMGRKNLEKSWNWKPSRRLFGLGLNVLYHAQPSLVKCFAS